MTTTPSDADLVQAWRNGDRDAGDVLFKRHFDAIFRFFANKVSDDVSDLVQRTFLGLIEAKERYRGEASVRSFLFAIARNELYKHFARRRRDQKLDFGVSTLRDLNPSASSLLRRKGNVGLLLEALRRIPLDLQIAIELYYFEELTSAQIATALDIPKGTVQSRIRRALEKLRAALDTIAGEPRPEWADEKSLDAWAKSLKLYQKGPKAPSASAP